MKIICRYAIILFLIFNLVGCTPVISPANPIKTTIASTPALEYWQGGNSFAPVRWAEEDVNSDGRQDTILIYQTDANTCMMCAILNTEQGFLLSESIKAPVENQTISFQDIDNKPPTEVIVSGSKNGKIGYGILRLENNQLIDIFGDSMKDCCD